MASAGGSFGDNFKREAEEDMLEYDDSAFYYFSMALLTCITLPFTYYTVKAVIFGNVHLDMSAKNAKTRAFQKLIATKQVELKRNMWTNHFYFRIFSMVLLLAILYANAVKVMSIEHLTQFDPFEILELESTATLPQIRRAYRKASLEKHPDKNKDNPLAVQEFIRLTKAYRVSESSLIN